jgi:GNAT superfamily N-acetyltransferase
VRSTLHWASITKLLDPEFLVPDAERVVGPAWVGYLDDELSIPRESPMGLLTGSSLVARLPELEHECDPVDWEHCGLNNSTPFITGYERNGKLVAAAGYELWGDTIAHIGVITHPTHRGKGLGRLVVREAARHALSQQLLPQYRTLIANVPAMRIGESLQFKKYAESIAVRLRSADSPI